MNNFSSFVYDGLSRNVSIVETTAGSVTSTKQFIWCSDSKRRFQPCEERDGSGTLTKKFFGSGQMNSITKYFYEQDHLGSIREMTDSAGVMQAQYTFDPYGRVTKMSETVAPDFGYADLYLHSRSSFNHTFARFYESASGRFINRDPIGEDGGLNPYEYSYNNPTSFVDLSGLDPFNLPWPFNGKKYPSWWQPIKLPTCPTHWPKPNQLNPWQNFPDWPPHYNSPPYDPWALPPNSPGNPDINPPNELPDHNWYPQGPVWRDPNQGIA